MRRAPASVLMAAAVVLCAATAGAETSQAVVTRTSRPLRLLHSWEETIKASGGREFPRRVEIIFNYSEGVGYEVSSTLDGQTFWRQRLGAGHPSPSREEIDEAFQIVRSDRQFARIFERFHVVLEGGFLLLEPPGKPCSAGSRCLRVFLLSSDRAGTIRQVVVDLVKRDVVYPDYVPEPWRAGK